MYTPDSFSAETPCNFVRLFCYNDSQKLNLTRMHSSRMRTAPLRIVPEGGCGVVTHACENITFPFAFTFYQQIRA